MSDIEFDRQSISQHEYDINKPIAIITMFLA